MAFNISLPTMESLYLNNITESHKDITLRQETKTSLAVFAIFIGLVGMVGNGVMIWLFSIKIKRNECTVYFLNLAITDFLYLLGMCIYLLYFICTLHGIYKTAGSKKATAIVYETLTNIGFNASSFLFTAISMERCISVLFPFYNKIRRPKYQSVLVCTSLWALALLTMALEVFVCDDKGNYLSPESKSCIPIIIFTTTLFAIALLLMIFSSMVLLVKIQKTSKFCRPPRLYIVILLTLITFFLSIVPSRVLPLLIFFDVFAFNLKALTLFLIDNICTALYCAANPYINILVARWGTQMSVKIALEKVFQD